MPAIRSTALILALIALPATASTQSLANRADSLVAAWTTGGAPGCAIAIDHGNDAVYRGAFGLADIEFSQPIGINTIFEAGSVSKQFTAASILLLVQRGKLALSDPIQKWFPEIPQYDSPITVNELMRHTSGIRDWGSVRSLAGWPRWSATYTQDDALAIIARQHGLNHTPGAKFSYTNSGYNLLAMLVERASGDSFEKFMQQEFFAPLGMTHTSWRSDYTKLVPGRAQAYRRSAGTWKLSMPFEDVIGNGGLLTTVGDMLRWTHALHDGRLSRPDVSHAMMTDDTLNDGSPVGYGGGLFLTPVRGVHAISHGGSTAGYRTVLATFPDQDYMVAILCNATNANPTGKAVELLLDVVPFDTAQPAPAPSEAPKVYRADPASFSEYVGSYHSDEVGATVTFTIVRGMLAFTRRPGEHSLLTPTGLDSFSGRGSEFHFVRDRDGNVGGFTVTISRVVAMPFSRID